MLAHNELTLTAAPHPLRTERTTVFVPEGMTLSQMLDLAQPDPILRAHAVACINGHPVPREIWSRVRPKAGTHVDVRVVPRGGGGGKNILRTVLMIGVLAAAFFLGPVVGVGLEAVFGVGSILGVSMSAIGSALVGLVGMLLVNVIAPVRPPKIGGAGADKEVPTIDGARNQGKPFQAIPAILGRHRIAPAYGSSPYTEILGGKHYLRLLFVWGVGPLAIDVDSLRIGDTPITEFEGIEIEHREGYEDDDPLTLYPGTVLQEEMTVLLEQRTGFVVRSTTPDADEIGFDITFPSGLVAYDIQDGSKNFKTVEFQIEYREVGGATWLTPSYSAKTVPDSWVTGNQVKFRYRKSASIREGFRFPVSPRGTYELRIKRLTQDNDNEDGSERVKGVVDKSMWTAFRTFTNEDPIQSAVPVAKTALRIKATDQLNHVIDEFNGIVTTIGKDWIPGVLWDDFPEIDAIDDIDAHSGYWEGGHEIQNPASLFRHVLQGNAIATPIADSRIDLDALGDFHEFCEAQGFRCNIVREGQSSVWDALADVAAAGRAAPTMFDGKWSVVIERPRAYPVSHITPHNSQGFSAEKIWPDLPDAWRIRFPNEDMDFRSDELRVYRDGHDRSTARKFESLELPGVTDPDQIWKLGRFRLAQGLLQAERWQFVQDMEFLAYRRGDRVLITHDVLLVGLGSGRIKAVVLDDDDNALSVTLTDRVTMISGVDYGISIRNPRNVAVTAQVVTVEGETGTLTFTTPIPPSGGYPAIEAGNLFGFGELGSETVDASIIDIRPDSDFRARVTAVPYDERVFDSDSAEIPEFFTALTPLPAIPAPSIRGIVTDETVLARGPGDALITRAVFDFSPVNDPRFNNPRIEIQGRPTETGEPWAVLDTSQESTYRIFISDIDSGSHWDFRIRYKMDGLLLPGPWVYRNNVLIVGMSTPPAGLQGMTISAIGGMAYIRWNRPEELDVRVGGRVQFRHSPAFTGAEWSQSASIGTVALADSLIAVLPLKPGTYLARVFDAIGTPSADIASVTTKQATILGFTSLDTINEAPTFPGTHDNTLVLDDTLRIAAAGLWDDIPDLDDEFSIDESGPPGTAGTYAFAGGFDFGSVIRVRLTTRIVMLSFAVNDLIDNRTDEIDDWEDIDGSAQAAGDCVVYVQDTDDDPSDPDAVWTEWNRLDSAEFQARGFRFKAELSTADAAFNVAVSELGIDAEELTP